MNEKEFQKLLNRCYNLNINQLKYLTNHCFGIRLMKLESVKE